VATKDPFGWREEETYFDRNGGNAYHKSGHHRTIVEFDQAGQLRLFVNDEHDPKRFGYYRYLSKPEFYAGGKLRRTVSRFEDKDGQLRQVAVSYGGREEIARAARAIARRVRRGELEPHKIDAGTVENHLATKGIPDPDLLIRTSGEMRISNFFLWQLAYTEIYVTDTLWPDFREREYLQALTYFQERQRRFGRTSEQIDRERLRAVN